MGLLFFFQPQLPVKDLAGTSKPRPRPLPGPPRDRVWAGGPKQPGGLIDPSLRTSSMAAHEAREDLKARWGLQYDPGEFAATSLRPVVPAGALTPRAPSHPAALLHRFPLSISVFRGPFSAPRVKYEFSN